MRQASNMQPPTDCVVVGASFAGLASATALARAGLRVAILEKKTDAGAKLHTTGIIVRDAIDQIPLLDTLPKPLVRRIPGVRLYAPNLRHIDLEGPGYYFLATNTPAVMRWLAGEAERAGAAIAYGTAFTEAKRLQSGFEVEGFGATRFLIGADGPHSRVASALHLGAASRALLVGDAAGIVSPVTAGGIHTALKHGLAAGNAVADFLHGRAEGPSGWFVRSYPKFRGKRLLRFLFDHFQSDLAFDWLLATWPMRFAASLVYFHHKGIFDPAECGERASASRPQRDLAS